MAIICLAALIIIQFIPANLPATSDESSLDIVNTETPPPEVKLILQRACYDCHSNQTVYPWYSNVAPVSWLVARDTRLGRDELNFSTWADLSKRKKIKTLGNIAEEVEDKKMPLKIYTFVHRDAILTDHEIETLSTWTKSLSKKILEGK